MEDQIPKSLEAEAWVIGGVLVDQTGEAIEHASKLPPEAFFQRDNRIIFESILDLHLKGNRVDIVSLMNHLSNRGCMDSIGGENFVIKHLNFPTGANTREWVELLKEKHLLRKLADLGSKIVKTCMNGADLSVISAFEGEIFNLSSSTTMADNRLQMACSEFERQIGMRREGKKVFGASSGIASFDKFFGGFQKGQYYVVAGRPSSGKTAMADQVTCHFLNLKRNVLYIALEASEDRVLTKIACKFEDISYSKFARGYCSVGELDRLDRALKFIKSSGLVLVRPNDITGTEIRSMMRREKRVNNIDLVIVDYLQKVTVPQRQDMHRAIGDASQQIQRACVETGVPALILVQLNREAEKERPRMSHLKESGQIEQDADNIILLWPEDDTRNIPEGEYSTMNMTIEKNKDGVRGYDLKMWFDGNLMKFKEIL